jgi:hypothetical protein
MKDAASSLSMGLQMRGTDRYVHGAGLAWAVDWTTKEERFGLGHEQGALQVLSTGRGAVEAQGRVDLSLRASGQPFRYNCCSKVQ